MVDTRPSIWLPCFRVSELQGHSSLSVTAWPWWSEPSTGRWSSKILADLVHDW